MSQFVALLKSSDCISSRNHCDSGFPAPESSGTKIGDHSYCVQQLASLSLTPHEFTEAPRVVPHFSAPERLKWKQAYMAAVLEKDGRRLPRLIQDARQKLSERLHELWGTGPVPSEEVEAIDDALYLLQALLGSLPYRDGTGS